MTVAEAKEAISKLPDLLNIPEDAHPWERLEGENNLWFDRFTRFRLLGPLRTQEDTYRGERDALGDAHKRAPRPSRHWTTHFKREQWTVRAEAWDEYERQKAEEAYEIERLREREKRLQILRDFRTRLEDAISGLQVKEAKWGDVTAAIKMINEEMRREFGEQVEKVHVTAGTEGGAGLPVGLVILPAKEAMGANVVPETNGRTNGRGD